MSSRAWLRLSVLLNLGLICAWVRFAGRTEPAQRTTGDVGRTVASAPARPSAPRPEPVVLSWENSMAQLRRAGVPSAIVARLVFEKVAQKWTPIEKQAEADYLNDRIKAKDLAEMHDRRAQEEESELRAALGDEYRAWDRENTVTNMYLGGLAPTEEQKEPLYLLQKDYLKRLHALEVEQREGRLDDKAFAAAHNQAEAGYKEALAQIIGRERVFGRDPAEVHFDEVRQDFARLGLDEAKVRSLAEVQRKWSEARDAMAESLAETHTLDVAYEGDLHALDRARDEEFRRILGADAFDAWQKAKDFRYEILQRNVRAWDMKPAEADTLYQAVRTYELATASYEYQAQVQAQQGQTVDWSTVEKNLADYTQKTESALRQYLGNEKFEQLKQQQAFSFRPPRSTEHELNARPSL